MASSTEGFAGLGRIGQIALEVGDLDAATAFYRDRLGMRFLFTAPPGMAFFDCDGVRLLLGLAEGEDGAGRDGSGLGRSGSCLYFDVPDIGAAHEALAGRGVEFIRAPEKVAELEETTLWLAFFRDPWGNTLALMSEVRN